MSKAGLVMIMIMTLASSLSAQTEPVRKKYTISGHVKDSKTGEAMIGATIMLEELPQIGTASNAYGFYSLTVSEGTYTLYPVYGLYAVFATGCYETERKAEY